MAYELFANNAQTTLSSGIISGSTSLTVASATPFPTTGNFRVLIDSEILEVTSVSGTTFSALSRGLEGTTAAAHASGALVTQVVTNGGLVQYRADAQPLTGTAWGSRPASALTGQLFIPVSGSPIISQYNGSSWTDILCNGMPITNPITSNPFTWVNQGIATVSLTNGGGGLELAMGTENPASMHILEQTFTEGQTVTALLCLTAVENTSVASQLSWFGISTRQPAGGTGVSIFGFTNRGDILWETWTSPTGTQTLQYNKVYDVFGPMPTGYFWLRECLRIAFSS